MKKKQMRVLKATKWLTLSVLLYLLFISVPQIIGNLMSEKIETQEELEIAVEIESERLGLQNVKIEPFLHDTLIGEARKISPNRWQIHLGGFYSTYSSLKHELYHIKSAKDLPSVDLAGYLISEEPRAVVYQALNIKI